MALITNYTVHGLPYIFLFRRLVVFAGFPSECERKGLELDEMGI